MRKSKKRTLKKSILVIVDGESEQIYLNSFKSSNIHIKPELPKKKALKDLYSYFKEEKQNYDKSFWIIDLDVPIKEGKISDVKDYKNNYPKEILINHPCLEYWFLLHFETKNFGNNCNEVLSYLKRKYDEFKSYDKSEKELFKVIDKLKEKLAEAITNAKNRECDFDNLINCSEMHRFFEEILKK